MTWQVGEFCNLTNITYTVEDYATEDQAISRAKMIARRYASGNLKRMDAFASKFGGRIFLAQGAEYGARVWEFDYGTPLKVQAEHRNGQDADVPELREQPKASVDLSDVRGKDLRVLCDSIPRKSVSPLSKGKEVM